uniref:Uncharacterized protein n=1 Tax=Amphimedon queenslandica TaxID=400682 RepID=A0A1X7UXM9_AMPQE
MATGSSDQAEVEIGSEKYSLLSVPEASSALVQSERKNFAGNIDLEKLVNYIEHVGKFIKVAYNGVNAAGPNFSDLQNQVQRLGFEITSLCNDSSVTVDRFRSTAATASSQLISVYQFLLDGFEDIAIQSLTSLGKLAEEMTKIAHELKEKFKMQAKKVEEALETSKIAKGEQAIRNKDLEIEQKIEEQKKKEYEKLVNRYYELAQEAKEEMRKYEKKVEKELARKEKRNTVFGVIKMVFSFPSDILGMTGGRSCEKAQFFKEKAKEQLEIRLKMEQYHLEGLQKLSEFAGKLQHMTTEKEMAQVAIEALHKASGGLRSLSVIMEEAARFWSYVQNHCQKLATTEIKEAIEMYATLDEEKRKRLWNNPAFIKKGVLYHAGWVALRDVCEEYGMRIESTRSGLYSFIQENPRYEESLARLPELTKEFTDAVDKGKKSITAKMNEKEQALTEYEHD